MLTIDATTGIMTYNSGRNSRNSENVNGTSSIFLFEHTKTFLCNKGLSHWGNTVSVRNAEYHDIRVSSMLFGQAAIGNALVNGRTPNLPNLKSQWLIGDTKMGFQFYDTYVQTILVNITFRNFSTFYGDYAIRYMDHSDHYHPQGINSVKNIRFEGVPDVSVLGIQNCGAACGTTKITESAKIYSVWDW
jgi:hypothetical protein